ncbi:YkgJ family cysteine cluster protein [Deefgea salmonis]|uniref:YkgJ family cysteine cluster protein n=1 Tax=Deefgea salmonis TaxID=2875502 RepID=A0ABS8BJJ3_9NEIS|nr:YkgJ family cysteine cluster protein [Deefgea salmonis]MCB5195802.1 YkgJ family cysteine cluster protein [Deefgea salmonis]
MKIQDQQIKILQEDGRVFVDMPDGDGHVCASCGACCNHFRVSFYAGEVAGSFTDHALAVPSDKIIMITPVYAAMKGTNQQEVRCISFKGAVGQSSHCSIYSQRSSTCREFYVYDEAGQPNPACQTARAAHQLKPLMPLATLSVAQKQTAEA